MLRCWLLRVRRLYNSGRQPGSGCVCGSWSWKHPASITSCPFEPSQTHQSRLKHTIIFKGTPRANWVQLRPQTVTLGEGVQLEQCAPCFDSILQCFHVCCSFSVLFLFLNQLLLCSADFNSEAAREDALPYSAWKCREGGPESVCPRGKLFKTAWKQIFLNQPLCVISSQSWNSSGYFTRDFCICCSVLLAFLAGLKCGGLNSSWKKVLRKCFVFKLMKVLSHAGLDNSKGSIVGNWTCFSFLRTFHPIRPRVQDESSTF